MALRDKWAKAGKGTGKAFSDLGKAIVKTVKVGVDKIDDEDKKEDAPKVSLKEKWSEVGHDFGDAGKSLGKAFAGTAKKVADKVSEAASDDEDEEEKKDK